MRWHLRLTLIVWTCEVLPQRLLSQSGNEFSAIKLESPCWTNHYREYIIEIGQSYPSPGTIMQTYHTLLKLDSIVVSKV